MKFIITAENTDSYAPVSNISIPLWSEYCDRHGYELSIRDVVDSERGPVWERVPHMLGKLKECDWVVHVDLDAIPTNMHIPLTEFIDNDKHIIISKATREDGSQMFNDGFMMVRKSASNILDVCWRGGSDPDSGIFCLQDRLWLSQRLYSPEDDYPFSVQPQKRFNSFLYSEYGMPASTPGNWTKGDFILHCPGMSTEKRVELLNKHLPEVLR